MDPTWSVFGQACAYKLESIIAITKRVQVQVFPRSLPPHIFLTTDYAPLQAPNQFYHLSQVRCTNLLVAVWYYFNDIYPPTHNGHRPLDPPNWWTQLWNWNTHDQHTHDENEATGAGDVQGELAAAAAPDIR